LIASGAARAEPAQANEFRELVHELGVQQVELEIQNQQLRETQDELQGLRDRFQDLYDFAPIGYVTLNRKGLIKDVNHTFASLLGCSKHRLLRTAFTRWLVPADREAWHALGVREHKDHGEGPLQLDLQLRAGEEVRHCSVSVRSICNEADQLEELWVTVQDISYRRAMEQRLRLASATIAAAREGIVITDANRRVIRMNAALGQLLDLDEEAVVGSDIASLLAPDEATRQWLVQFWTDAAAAEGSSEEVQIARGQSGRFFATMSLVVMRDDAGTPTHLAAFISDVSRRRAADDALRHQANYDHLTGLANRSLAWEHLAQAVRQAHRDGNTSAFMLVDLDRFKQINDVLGHEVGDILLRQVADRLTRCVRESDTVSRLGGDEFGVILNGSEGFDADVAAEVASKILEAMSQPFLIADNEVYTEASIGIALFPQDSEDIDDIRQSADMAMYRAKNKGRGTYEFFAPHMTDATVQRLYLEQDLRRAIGGSQFSLFFQPIHRLTDGSLTGAEALLRWNHPERGLLSPDSFIECAENSGAIREITEWVLEETARESRRWSEFTDSPPFVSINLSGRQFASRDGFNGLYRLIESEGIAPDRLVLEITEKVIMSDILRSAEQIQSIRLKGIRVALDDFGTGYSSFMHLKHFPVDIIKLDRHFTADMLKGGVDSFLVEGVVDISHRMQLPVIAEGVETEAQADWLRGIDCDYVQGFRYSVPLPAPAFRKLLRQTSRSGGANECAGECVNDAEC
jgi:diguanylate cyclase (GGDEF)-like protein/PAS domain S-box-containing protein